MSVPGPRVAVASPRSAGNVALTVRDLRVRLQTDAGVVHAVNGVSLDVREGETLGVVGESGSGKSVTFLAVLGLLPQIVPCEIEGEIRFGGRDLMRLRRDELRRLRGSELALIFQDPQSALNPLLKVGTQIAEVVSEHEGLSRSDAWTRAVETLELVGIPQARRRADSYPFEFSGGMRQRVMIALAIACRPRVIVADEPTTALDVTIQAQILELLDSLRRDLGMGVVMITHDLGLVARYATQVAVMYGGRVLEHAPVRALFAEPQNPYTVALLHSLPRLQGGRKGRLESIPGEPPDLREPPPGCPFQTRCAVRRGAARCAEEMPELREVEPGHRSACHFIERLAAVRTGPAAAPEAMAASAGPEAPAAAPEGAAAPPFVCHDEPAVLRVEGVSKAFPLRRGRRQYVHAVSDVSFDMRAGETLGLVGESGSGKSTLGRLILRLQDPTAGRILFRGEDVTALRHGALRALREEIQVVFQDPKASLNPRMTVERIVGEPLVVRKQWGPEGRRRVHEMLELVGLGAAHAERYPHEFSGGQQQRIGLARALILRPAMLVLDEPISSLDVSIQAQIINLLMDLQGRLGLTYVFIAHDLSIVHHVSDRIAVMYLGRIVELADASEVFARPLHPYTVALLSAIPVADPDVSRDTAAVALRGSLPSPIDIPAGCPFHTRCPRAREIAAGGDADTVEVQGERLPRACIERRPELAAHAAGHWAACHFPRPGDRQGAHPDGTRS